MIVFISAKEKKKEDELLVIVLNPEGVIQ